METIKKKKLGVAVIGIVLAKNWHPIGDAMLSIARTDFVVGKWFNFSDGQKDNLEGKQTIAICKESEDAELIYQRHINLLNKKS